MNTMLELRRAADMLNKPTYHLGQQTREALQAVVHVLIHLDGGDDTSAVARVVEHWLRWARRH